MMLAQYNLLITPLDYLCMEEIEIKLSKYMEWQKRFKAFDLPFH